MNQYFIEIAVSLGMILLIWNCFEVGRNDAANLVNAVFGSRVMTRRRAVYIAGVFVVLGSIFASPVMDTVRKGIFDIEMLDAVKLISLYIGSYLVGTVLLYSYSAFGMPVSTTATLVFCLAGGAIGVGGSFEVVNWSTFTKVVSAIVISIFMSGIAGFFVQRIFRGAFDDKGEDHTTLLLHGPWVTGLMMTALTWFMAMKGLKGISFIEILRTEIIEQYGTLPVLLGYWAILTLAVYLLLLALPKEKTKYLFHVTAVVGMCCLSFAFGQNDLANAVSPGLASFFIWKEGMASSVDIPRWALFT
ncbi:MAG: inorganic phosphate transporter, partial [Methylococcales bacterium]